MLKQRLLAALLVSSLGVSSAWAAEVTFSDVTPDSLPWAYEAIEAFAEKGIIDGVGNGLFQPKALVTREQFAKMLSLTFALDTASPDAPVETSTNPPPFVDVTPDTLSADSISYIQSVQPYFPGYSNTDGHSFLPQQVATREEITAACMRVLSATAASTGATGDSTDSSRDVSYASGNIQEAFSDYAAISEERRADVAVALDMGLVQGYEDGTFRPQAGVNRAQAVVMLNRALAIAQKQAEQAATTPSEPATTPDEEKTDGNDSSDTPSTSGTDATDGSDTSSSSGTDATDGSDTSSTSGTDATDGSDTSSSSGTKPNEEDKPIASTGSPSAGESQPTTSHSTNRDVWEVGEFYGYVLQDPYATSVDGQQFSVVTLWTGEEVKDIRLEGHLPSFGAGAVLHYTLMSDGSLRQVGEVHGQFGALVEYSNNQDRVVILTTENGRTEYEITEDSRILYVDSQDRTGEYGSFQKAQLTEEGYINNVWVFAYGDDVECLVVDVNNQLLY